MIMAMMTKVTMNIHNGQICKSSDYDDDDNDDEHEYS